ncbi:MAG TPA: tRNA (adenosine(37)-N6)-threonylcarbamoyltransferase complex ATPase subunit type 1 TsaE, partial [Burkholderiales bacterium]|nr:tRNA (adenosine(37)-N6)-threonylcarbamoyltransferase complex ATPase subunit type 1 TsaE [Burkholderiales bacterium]
MNSAAVELSAFLPDEAATLGFGEKLAQLLQPGLFVALSGELGSGKTTLARGILRGLGYEGKVKSPTYTLV